MTAVAPAPPESGPAVGLPPAGADRRLTAFLVDRAVTWVVGGLLAYGAWRLLGPDHGGWAVLAAVAAVLLVVVLSAAVAGTTGSSPGRALTGVRLVRADDAGPLGAGPAIGRALLLELATLPTFGFAAAALAWTAMTDPGRRRRGWHDRVTGSMVIDVRAASGGPDPEPAAPPAIVNLTALRLQAAADASASAPASTTTVSGPAPTAAAAPPLVTPPLVTPPLPAPPVTPPSAPVTPAVGEDAAPVVVRPPAGVRPRPRPISPTTPQPPRAPARWRLVFDSGETLLVEGLGLIGRRPEPRAGEEVRHLVPLRSRDMSLSKTHAQVHLVDGTLVIMDRGSTNGSTLTRQGVSRELTGGRPATLLEGDRVRLGDREMTVRREV